MKISVSGKGGSGKTTISGTLARLLGRSAPPVLAIDADSNPNLGLTLGLDKDSFDLINPLPHGLLEHRRTNGEVELKLTRPLDEIEREYGVECADETRLLVLGTPKGAGTGWMCSSYATVRGLLHELSNEQTVVVDTEASPEHLSRGTTEAVDTMLVVAEPYFKSLETARRYAGLGKDLGIDDVFVVANKVRSEDDREAIAEFCQAHDLEMIASIPFDDALGEAERAGTAPLDHVPSSDAIAAIGDLMDRVAGRS